VASASWPRVAAWPRPPRRASRPAIVTLAAPSQRGRYYSLALPAGATVALPVLTLSVAGWPARPRGPAARAPGGRRCVCVSGGPGPAGAGGLGAGGPGASAVPAQPPPPPQRTASPDERQPDRSRCSAPGAIVPLCGLRLEGSCRLPVACQCAVTCGDSDRPAAKWALRAGRHPAGVTAHRRLALSRAAVGAPGVAATARRAVALRRLGPPAGLMPPGAGGGARDQLELQVGSPRPGAAGPGGCCEPENTAVLPSRPLQLSDVSSIWYS
jgi:hypothetical protein